MGSRTWIKIYCDKWLSGTLRDEQPVLRGMWIDLLALAGSGRYGDTGEIKLSDGVGLTDGQIAGILKIPLKLWLEAKKHFIETARISLKEDNNIVITNWQKYQSEYERQKKFRVESDTVKLQQDVTSESDKEKEKEKEGKREEPSPSPLHLKIYNEFINNFNYAFGHQPNAKELARIRDLSHELAEHNCSVETIKDALKEAAGYNKSSLSYVRAIILDWIGVKR